MNDIAISETKVLGFASPLLDENYFGQVMKLADVMASSSLLPKTLVTEKIDNREVAIPFETVKANCFLIANQAFKWKADPFAIAAASSVVHGRLMFEGKLVHAILEANLGIKLRIQFGKWDAKKEVCDLSEEGSGDMLACRVYEELKDGAIGRFIDGFVGAWKTTGANSPWRPGNNKKMCLYRGSREWARWYEPGIMLGIVTDDEAELFDPKDITPPKAQENGSSVIERLKATQEGKAADGFDAGRVETETQQSSTAKVQDDAGLISDPASDEEEAGASKTPASISSETKTDEKKPVEERKKPETAADAGKAAESSAGANSGQEDTKATNSTADDEAWLQNVTRMLWGATWYGKGEDVLKAQRKAAAASYPADAVSEKYRKKANSVFDRCMDLASSTQEPDDVMALVSGTSGIEESELKAIWAKRDKA